MMYGVPKAYAILCLFILLIFNIKIVLVIFIAIIFTPHVSDVMGVIVLTSSVCLSVSLFQPNGQTYRLEFWHGGQVEGYLGQGKGHRSNVKVTRSKNMHWDIPLTSESLAKKTFRNTTGRNTTWGVFKACVFFLFIELDPAVKEVVITVASEHKCGTEKLKQIVDSEVSYSNEIDREYSIVTYSVD